MTRSTTWSAPGRVNLIGEHTDYNEGYVLPFALPQRTIVTASRRDTPDWIVRSDAASGSVSFGLEQLVPGGVPGWGAYVAGVVWALRESGVDVPGAELAITSTVPVGAGLSSSAALECAVLAALADLAGAAPPRPAWPRIAQRAENAYVGVPCGIMDQSAAALCRIGHALFLDCRSLDTEQVPFAPADAGLSLLVIDTRAPHRHAENEYADRRAACEAAAAVLGVRALRDAGAGDLARLDEPLRRRARHVVTENARVLDAVAALRAGRVADLGPLLTASHASLRDDFAVTVPELDTAVEAALAAGALGARMTGGGFGGCVIALAAAAAAEPIGTAVAAAFAARGFTEPAVYPVEPADGVARG